jgi:hypothetical protein
VAATIGGGFCYDGRQRLLQGRRLLLNSVGLCFMSRQRRGRLWRLQ